MNATSAPQDFEARRKRFERLGLMAVIGFVVLAVIAATVVRITGAVTAVGTVVQSGENKEIQHPEGGPVAKILVQNGDLVEEGQELILLDGTMIMAQFRVNARRQFELKAKLARLQALDRGDVYLGLQVPPDRRDDAQARDVVATQRSLFESSRARMVSNRERFEERKRGVERELVALERQIRTNDQQVQILDVEIEEVAELLAEQLVSKSRLTALQRQRVGVLAQMDSLRVQRTRLRNTMAEGHYELALMESEVLDQTRREIEAAKTEMEEVARSLDATQDRLSRLSIKSPAHGWVHEINVHNIDAVVRPGETVLRIVPVDAGPIINARVSLMDIDQVSVGQEVRVRFDTFDMRTTPEVFGKVQRVSNDRSTDEQTGEVYYTVIVSLSGEELARLEGHDILAGLPATAMFTTGERTLIDYLTKPLRETLFAAFRDG